MSFAIFFNLDILIIVTKKTAIVSLLWKLTRITHFRREYAESIATERTALPLNLRPGMKLKNKIYIPFPLNNLCFLMIHQIQKLPSTVQWDVTMSPIYITSKQVHMLKWVNNYRVNPKLWCEEFVHLTKCSGSSLCL